MQGVSRLVLMEDACKRALHVLASALDRADLETKDALIRSARSALLGVMQTDVPVSAPEPPMPAQECSCWACQNGQGPLPVVPSESPPPAESETDVHSPELQAEAVENAGKLLPRLLAAYVRGSVSSAGLNSHEFRLLEVLDYLLYDDKMILTAIRRPTRFEDLRKTEAQIAAAEGKEVADADRQVDLIQEAKNVV